MSYEQFDEIAQAAAHYVRAYFDSRDHEQVPTQWVAALDGLHHVGMNINTYEGCIALTAWRGGSMRAPACNEVASEALMRLTFDTRLDNGLVGCIRPDLGLGVSVPLYASYDTQTLTVAIEQLLRELDGITLEPVNQPPPIFLPLAEESVCQTEAMRAEKALATLAQACGHTDLSLHARHFDLLFDDLPGRISLHPSNRLVVADFFLNDAATISGALRRAVVKSALVINQAALHGHVYAVGLDSRDFVVGTGRITLDRLTENFWPRWLHYQVSQARDTQSLIKRLAMENAEIVYTLKGDSAAGWKAATA